jgi:multiple sugar transport system ATP-binding protein
MATLNLKNVSKSFGTAKVLHSIDLAIKDKEFVVFVGPSGCGKSTLLRIIAGLEAATSGHILIDGVDVSAAAPVDRGISMVFQSYALYPHLSVYENIAFPLRVARLPEAEVKQKVGRAAEILQLTEKLGLKPGQLSGGQRQRVAIARALVGEPSILLADEPTGNLDSATGEEIIRLFDELNRRGHTIILVTHEPRLAARCPRAIRLTDGRIVGDGPGAEVAAIGAARVVHA